jgi:hypothetical protein
MYQAGLHLNARGPLKTPLYAGRASTQPANLPEKAGRSKAALMASPARQRVAPRWRRSGRPPRQSPAGATGMEAMGAAATALPAKRGQTAASRAPPWYTTALDHRHHAGLGPTPNHARPTSATSPREEPLGSAIIALTTIDGQGAATTAGADGGCGQEIPTLRVFLRANGIAPEPPVRAFWRPFFLESWGRWGGYGFTRLSHDFFFFLP